MQLAHYRPSRKTVFWCLMGLSAFTLILPPRVTDGVKHGTQLLVPVQDAVFSLTFQGARRLERAANQEKMREREVEALTNQIASQAGQIQQLQSENEDLSAMRAKSIPRALHAHVVSRDIVEWRDSVLIERGSNLGVNPQDWVASRLFLNQGAASDVSEGFAVISRDVLLGRVEQVSPYMSRVCLFSDVNSQPLKVRVGGFVDGQFETVDYPCIVHGRGNGEMVIRNVDYRRIENPPGGTAESQPANAADEPLMPERSRGIRVGDLVYSAPGQLGLPVPMAIGRVTRIVEDPSRRLVYDVIAEPSLRVDEVRTVSVIPLIPTDVAMDGE
ncbi:MAG TPA: rod shape-determining protein MreC [Phycisphaerae bacterium]|nr:rod shape-determining protein MreC [Phycisphaerae bacterium]